MAVKKYNEKKVKSARWKLNRQPSDWHMSRNANRYTRPTLFEWQTDCFIWIASGQAYQ